PAPTSPPAEAPAAAVSPSASTPTAAAPEKPAEAKTEPATPTETPAAPAASADADKAPATSSGDVNPEAVTAPNPVASSSSDSAIREAELHGLSRKLRIAATKANQEIYDAACADIAKAGMGTTLTGLLLVRTHVIVAQVGDSRAYMCRKGKLTQ